MSERKEPEVNIRLKKSSMVSAKRIEQHLFNLFLLLCLVFVVYIFFMAKSSVNIQPLPEDKTLFYNTVDDAIFASDSISLKIESIKMIYNSVDRESNGRLFNYGFVNLLEDYLVRNSADSSKNLILNNPKIFELIKNELQQEPYNRLNTEQKRLLTNLDKALRNNDSILVKFNLDELNDLLRLQNEYIEKLEFQNSWSIPMSIIGIILTIIFGASSGIKRYFEKFK